MTADEFADLIRQVEGYWPNKAFEEGTLDVWWSQMQAWRYELVLIALPTLARELVWLPSFSQMSQAYAIEVTKADRPRQNHERHLHVAQDPELREKWRRVISAQLSSPTFGTIAKDESPIGRAVRRHYRVEGVGLVVLDGHKMLADAEQALAEDAFGQET